MRVRRRQPKYLQPILEICYHNHFTVKQIWRRLRDMYPEVGLTTVYRQVRHLEKTGRLHAVDTGDDALRYENTPEPHAHLICPRTDTVVDIPLTVLFNENAIPPEFEAESIDIRIFGKWRGQN